jgi:hypothetical protein
MSVLISKIIISIIITNMEGGVFLSMRVIIASVSATWSFVFYNISFRKKNAFGRSRITNPDASGRIQYCYHRGTTI